MAEFDPIASGQNIGEGWAQVFKPYEDDNYTKALELAAKKKEKAEEAGKAKQKDIMKELSGIKKIDILPDDQEKFADKQLQLYKYVSDNIDDLMKDNPQKSIEFNRMMTELANDAAHSKNYREEHEKLGYFMAQHPDIYTKEAKEAWKADGTSSFDDKGAYKNIDITRYDKKMKPVNLNDFFKTYYTDVVDKQKKVYNTSTKKGRDIITETHKIRGKDDLQNLFNSVLAGATDDVTEAINAKYLAEADKTAYPSSKDWAWATFGSPFVQEVLGKNIKQLPQERLFGDRTVFKSDRGRTDTDYEISSSDVVHWNRGYDPVSKELLPDKPIKSITPSFSATLNKPQTAQFQANKLYNPYDSWTNEKGEEDPNKVGSWVDNPLNEKFSFQQVTYMPYEISKGRFLTKEEYQKGKHSSGKVFSKIEMHPVIPISREGYSYFLDAKETDVAKAAGFRFKGNKIPTWSEVYDALPEDEKSSIPTWAVNQADRERPAETEEKGKAEAKQKGGGGTPPPAKKEKKRFKNVPKGGF